MRAVVIPLFAALATFLAGCGFQLRGSYGLPFDTLYVALPESAELHAQIKRNVESGSQTRLVGSAPEAQATLTILRDQTQKSILSLDGTGRIREYQLTRVFSFRVTDAKNSELLPPGDIVLRRELTYSDTQVLAKESEEAVLWRDMQNDLVQQLLRRLAAARPKTG